VSTYSVRLEDLGPALEGFVARAIPVMYVALRDAVVEAAYYKVQELSPVATGRYKASHTISADSPRTVALATLPAYPIGGAPEVEAALAAAGPDSVIYIANAAADPRYASRPGGGSYAAILEGGRREYTRLRTGRTQWIGSLQAPNGIYGPARDALLAESVTIVGNAVARARERL
jgi:hypothetical protein